MVVGVWFVFIGGVTSVLFLGELLEARKSSSWPTVRCTVISATVNRHPPRGKHATYRPDIRYAYSVEGASYVGDRVFLGDASRENEYWVRGIVARYPPDATVNVYYNPDDPSMAVLEPGATWFIYLWPAAGAAFAIAGVAMACSGYRDIRRWARETPD